MSAPFQRSTQTNDGLGIDQHPSDADVSDFGLKKVASKPKNSGGHPSDDSSDGGARAILQNILRRRFDQGRNTRNTRNTSRGVQKRRPRKKGLQQHVTHSTQVLPDASKAPPDPLHGHFDHFQNLNAPSLDQNSQLPQQYNSNNGFCNSSFTCHQCHGSMHRPLPSIHCNFTLQPYSLSLQFHPVPRSGTRLGSTQFYPNGDGEVPYLMDSHVTHPMHPNLFLAGNAVLTDPQWNSNRPHETFHQTRTENFGFTPLVFNQYPNYNSRLPEGLQQNDPLSHHTGLTPFVSPGDQEFYIHEANAQMPRVPGMNHLFGSNETHLSPLGNQANQSKDVFFPTGRDGSIALTNPFEISHDQVDGAIFSQRSNDVTGVSVLKHQIPIQYLTQSRDIVPQGEQTTNHFDPFHLNSLGPFHNVEHGQHGPHL